MIKKFLIVFLIAISSVSYGMEDKIILPKPKIKGDVSLEECIYKRRSQRSFINKKLNLAQISQLLWAAQGITDKKRGFRASPSAGATYPLEIYIVTSFGVFHYEPDEHKIIKIKDRDMRKSLSLACLGQSWVKDAEVNIVISAVYSRTTGRYGDRGIRYVYLEAGHCAQNIHLQAVALGLGSVPVGAFLDDEVKKVLSLPKDCEPIYVIPVGYVR